jgi:hypothetical protein
MWSEGCPPKRNRIRVRDPVNGPPCIRSRPVPRGSRSLIRPGAGPSRAGLYRRAQRHDRVALGARGSDPAFGTVDEPNRSAIRAGEVDP